MARGTRSRGEGRRRRPNCSYGSCYSRSRAADGEVDHRVGSAIATIGSNLPEMGRGVRELAALMPDRHRAGDLVDAARKLCGAFSDFLTTVNPDHQESRTTVLAAAGRVGDFSQAVINTIEDQSSEEKVFHDDLAHKARNVATSTAQLVLRAKTISAECEDQALHDKVIHSATQCAYATSQLVACARVVAPTIETPSCQDQLANAAKQVARAVEDLLVDANSACQKNRNGVEAGRRQLGDIHDAARQVTSALDGLLDHVKTSPRQVKQTTEEERYEDVLRTSRRLITTQDSSQDMVRQSENVIRHSRLLVEEMEHEAADMSPDQRDKLLSAARSVAQATSHMIDATKECQSRPQDIESQMALRTAAEQLVQTTTEATSEQQAKRTMERLEQAAKHTAAAATQTIAAASSARPKITSHTVTETLAIECTETPNTFLASSPVSGKAKLPNRLLTNSALNLGLSRIPRSAAVQIANAKSESAKILYTSVLCHMHAFEPFNTFTLKIDPDLFLR
ncbi:hypothetical protein L596_016805 [Steinernema carpocapsae]|uniref:Uncharacterized protein n=1 Tax=Steinernema carpocapsae TaxID=34508 RepID=A0A4V6A3J5_STECR|nr:hypothetical protein L596_016805 [Steinernema carpocapsae]